MDQFINTFVFSLSDQGHHIRELHEVPHSLPFDPSRQRREHRKSKTGCHTCKLRRVKCDDKTPCGNCSRREEECSKTKQTSPVLSKSISPTPRSPTHGSYAPNDRVNLLYLKLFHHFHTNTCSTLLLSESVWSHAVQLSFSFDFLASAILCLSARHLAYLHPSDPTYPVAAVTHLSRAIIGFHRELNNNLTSAHLDVFIATAVLLQFEVWSHPNDESPKDQTLRPSQDRVFEFCSSLKNVFLNSFPETAIQSSIFLDSLREGSELALLEASQIKEEQIANSIFTGQLAFSPAWLESPILESDNELKPPDNELSSSTAIKRLCLIWSFVPPRSLPADPVILRLLARCILFPIACHGPLMAMDGERKIHAQLWLYHFYRATRILLGSDEYWWAHKRSTFQELHWKAQLLKYSRV